MSSDSNYESDSEIEKKLEEKLNKLYLKYDKEKINSKLYRIASVKRNDESSDEEQQDEEANLDPVLEVITPKPVKEKAKRERVNSDITYSCVINGKEKTYKYRTSMLRGQFLDAQRDEFKRCCKNYGITFINEMFLILANYYWKVCAKGLIGVDEDKLVEPFDLIAWAGTLNKELLDEIFRRKPYYKNYIKMKE